MSELAVQILLTPLAIILYGSGLLLWPIRRWRLRKDQVRGKSLGFVFLGQCIAFVVVGLMAAIRPQLVEHGYYWCVILIEINLLFTFVAAGAWIRDANYKRSMDDKTTSEHPVN